MVLALGLRTYKLHRRPMSDRAISRRDITHGYGASRSILRVAVATITLMTAFWRSALRVEELDSPSVALRDTLVLGIGSSSPNHDMLQSGTPIWISVVYVT